VGIISGIARRFASFVLEENASADVVEPLDNYPGTVRVIGPGCGRAETRSHFFKQGVKQPELLE
jgi:hypothetical protein